MLGLVVLFVNRVCEKAKGVNEQRNHKKFSAKVAKSPREPWKPCPAKGNEKKDCGVH